MSHFRPSQKLRPLLLDPTQPFIHRDLSWLAFNRRVLDEAELSSNPLLERLKFLSISSSNLDEFFMIRMAALGRSIASEVRRNDPTMLRRLRRVRSVILGNVNRMIEAQHATLKAIAAELFGVGVQIVEQPRENDGTLELGRRLFEERVLPELSAPESYAPSQLPLLENLQLAVVFESGSWLRVPKRVKTALAIRDERTNQVYIFFLDRLLEAFVAQAFRIEEKSAVIRITRDADLSVDLEEEDPESIPDVMRTSLGKRERGRAVRFQGLSGISKDFLTTTQKALKLSPQQLFVMPRTFCLHGLWSVLGELPESLVKNSGLSYPPLVPHVPPELHGSSEEVFKFLTKRDFLLHHPYDSFDAYVAWIRAACTDAKTTMIQQTVYRMDALSPVIDLLKSAAGAGKKVRVVIELRARFDELNNLRLADELRKAGVEVTFGFGNLKLHAKVALVTRVEDGAERLYTHLSTGNYNSVTARQYTDLAILTADQDIGADAAHFFESVWKHEIPTSFKRLVPAPTRLHRRIMQLIDVEIAAANSGAPARIVGKVNSLVDEAVIKKLYEASSVGVKIELIVRGACSLVPGIKGLSENIRVISIIDRLLEHSRIYYFENSKVMYISSADWMPRNFFSRLELAFPVVDTDLYRYLESVVLPTYLTDGMKARELNPDGAWITPEGTRADPAMRSQFFFEQLARSLYKGTPLE